MAVAAHQDLPAEHVTVFLDVLGFSEYITGCAEEPQRVSTIFEILNNFGQLKQDLESNALRPNRLQLSAFSDSIVISAPASGFLRGGFNLAWPYLRTALGDLSFKMLEQGLPLRGGVALGWLRHERNIVFGKGLISAVEIEHRRAQYPRIVIDEQVVASSGADLLFRDKDGEWVLDIFSHAPNDDHLRSLADVIEQRLLAEWERTPRRHRVLMKYSWLANSYNDRVRSDLAQVTLPKG